MLVALGLAVALAPDVRARERADPVPRVAPSRPNILLITSDDQAATDLRWMPRTRRLLAAHGVELTHAISPHPLCCPARAEIMTGKYAQNSGVRHNTGRWGGYAAFVRGGNRPQNLGVWLRRAGYRTAFVGKFLNGYHPHRDGRLPGWTHWNPTGRNTYAYYGTTFWNDGRPRAYPTTYVADVVRDATVRYVREFAHGSRPFFIWASHVGPHQASGEYVRRHLHRRGFVPPIPAHRHERLFRHTPLPDRLLPSFNEADVSDKPHALRRPHPRPVRTLVETFLQRIRSLQAIDEANARAVRALAATGELANTYVLFLSDNGYLLGEHRLQGKNFGFREDLRVPFLVRGPGVPEGVQRDQVATTVSLAATFLDVAGVLPRVSRRHGIDGASLVGVLGADDPVAQTQLIQAGTSRRSAMRDPRSLVPGWWWRGVQAGPYVYTAWYDGAETLYDLDRDPHELLDLVDVDHGNQLRDPAYGEVLTELRRRFAVLRDCAGTAACQHDFGPLPAVTDPPPLAALRR